MEAIRSIDVKIVNVVWVSILNLLFSQRNLVSIVLLTAILCVAGLGITLFFLFFLFLRGHLSNPAIFWLPLHSNANKTYADAFIGIVPLA